MIKNKLLKQILVILVIGFVFLVINIREVSAALQANRKTQYTKVDSPTNWMINFRNMEKSGEAMELNEMLNEDLTASTESNNIDVHMMRTTEYGAIAILSASGYGNLSNNNQVTSTTGNNTGMILNTTYSEFTAGGIKDIIFSGVEKRYYDTYLNSDWTSARVGDALRKPEMKNPGCVNWHGSTVADWVQHIIYPYILRGRSGIFSFSYNGAHTGDYHYSRGVVVCGTEV